VIARWLTPPRRRGIELLDLPATPDDVRRAAMRDVERSNALFGGMRSVVRAVLPLLRGLRPSAILLDVATGTGDVPGEVKRRAGSALRIFGVDLSLALARRARERVDGVVVGDAVRLPFADRSVDVVTCSQALHHFFDDDARHLVAELHRVARGHVIVSDIRRSRLAAVGFWIASVALRFHSVTRRDGVTSVFRGFTAEELRDLVRDVTGITPEIRRGVFWRLSATWPAEVGRIDSP
jgi:ubiquinone/menaquinone biosynthesis C-methylase UbiE